MNNRRGKIGSQADRSRLSGSEVGLFEETLEADNRMRIAGIDPSRQSRQPCCASPICQQRQLKKRNQRSNIEQLQLLGNIGLMHMLAFAMTVRCDRILNNGLLMTAGWSFAASGHRSSGRVRSRKNHARHGLRLTDREDQQNEAHAQSDGLARDTIHGLVVHQTVPWLAMRMMLESIPKYRVKYAIKEPVR